MNIGLNCYYSCKGFKIMKNYLALSLLVALLPLSGCSINPLEPKADITDYSYFKDGYYNKCRRNCEIADFYESGAWDNGFYGNRYTDRRGRW